MKRNISVISSYVGPAVNFSGVNKETKLGISVLIKDGYYQSFIEEGKSI